jgi:glycosyltransferase involved in cell wall biosynthesis
MVPNPMTTAAGQAGETAATDEAHLADAPLVSVLVNCYNGERFVRHALDSIFAQTYQNWEMIFWDNQSTDQSAAIVRAYADPRVRYFYAPKHTNLAPARRFAVQQARGEYVCFLDCDDIYLPDNLEKKIAWMQRTQAAAAFGGVIYIDEDGATHSRRMPRVRSGMILESLLKQFDADISTLIVSRRVMTRLGINFSNDIVGSTEYDLLMQLAATEPCVVIPEYLAKLRRHRGSLTYSLIGDWANDRNYTLRQIRRRLPGIAQQYAEAFAEAYARADYYHARWLVANGRRADALACLRHNWHAGWKYIAVYLALRISTGCWHLVHRYLPSARRL